MKLRGQQEDVEDIAKARMEMMQMQDRRQTVMRSIQGTRRTAEEVLKLLRMTDVYEFVDRLCGGSGVDIARH